MELTFLVGVCATNNGNVEDCTFEGTAYIAGSEGTVDTLRWKKGVGSPSAMFGGICCINYGTIKNCSNISNKPYDNSRYYDSSIISDSSVVGGICAVNYSDITDCYNEGKFCTLSMKACSKVGGIVGAMYDGKLNKCHNTGNFHYSHETEYEAYNTIGRNSWTSVKAFYRNYRNRSKYIFLL